MKDRRAGTRILLTSFKRYKLPSFQLLADNSRDTQLNIVYSIMPGFPGSPFTVFKFVGLRSETASLSDLHERAVIQFLGPSTLNMDKGGFFPSFHPMSQLNIVIRDVCREDGHSGHLRRLQSSAAGSRELYLKGKLNSSL